MIIAAEASSCLYAERLLEYWDSQKKNIQYFGVGSKKMEDLGFDRIGRSEEMAVVGAAEVIEHYSHLKEVFNRLVEEAKKRKPNVVILLDYPDFNLMLAKEMHSLGIPCVYYISPQVWAWREGRVKKIKKYIQKVFVIFPFEKTFYQKHGVQTEFVGHPMLDELKAKYFDPEYFKTRRSQCGIAENEIVVGLMPGSRKSELKYHIETQKEVARKIYKNHANVRFLVLTAPTVDKEKLKESFADFGVPFILQKDEPFEMINLCDVVLAASGTATLMVGLLNKPMVIMYKMNPYTAWVFKLLVRGIKYFGITNLILNEEVVPERFQEKASTEELYRLMTRFLDDKTYYQSVVERLKDLHEKLGDKGATVRVAKALEVYF